WYSPSRRCLPQKRHRRGAACSFIWLLKLRWERKPRRQSDILQPLAQAGFQTVTGTFYRDGRIVQAPPTNWTDSVIVGPFANDAAAQGAMQRLIPILRPIALARASWDMPDD